MRTLLLLLVSLILAGCAQDLVEPQSVVPTPTKTLGGNEMPGPSPTPAEVLGEVKMFYGMPPGPADTLGEEELSSGISRYGADGVIPLEEMIAWSHIIVRGRFASATPVGVRSANSRAPGKPPNQQFDGYLGSLEVTFDVIEYLKGSGGTQVSGIAYGNPVSEMTAATLAEAAVKAQRLLAGRDNRWDDREAIVFLRQAPVNFNPPLRPQLDHYWLGEVSTDRRSHYQFTVASAEDRAWLPDASSTPVSTTTSKSTSARSATEQRFLLADPGPGSSGGQRSSAAAPSITSITSITLSALKQQIDDNKAEIALGDGSTAYQDCIAATLTDNLIPREYHLWRDAAGSGLPVGSIVHTYHPGWMITLETHGWTKPATGSGERWLEGRDADVLAEKWPGYIITKRPLVAGEYRVFAMSRSDEMVICDGDASGMRGKYEYAITVTAPEGTLAEAFYDPVADGAATTATTTVGTIRWESGTVKATLNLTVTGHILDFIALDGSVTLSLEVSDATETDGVLSWTVASSPWSAGDKLMLRIR